MTDAEIAALLTGKHLRLLPYVRGHWPPETLVVLWRMVRDEGAQGKIFFAGPGSTTPFPTQGDLVHFIKFFDPEPPVQRLLLIAHSAENDLAGLFWFDDFVPGHRVTGNVCYRRRYWGEPAREASRLALAYGFEVLGVRSIWAYSPWKTGIHHGEAVGMTQVATLPDFAMAGGQALDLAILRMRREDF